MSNGVIYARYSAGPRQTDQSIEGQLRDCEEYARRNDITIIDTYIDRHISGTDFENRVSFNRMLRDASKKQFDVIIVWKIDRFGRNREEIVVNKIKIKKYGVRLAYAKEYIPDGPEGIILESLMEGMAEYYSAELSQKVRRGYRESAIKGFALGGSRPYGYSVVDKKYVINEVQAGIVRFVFESYDQGKTVPDILEILHQRGVLANSGKEFTRNGIYNMLRNPKYIGEFFYDDIPIAIPRIISQELWESVHATFKKRVGTAASFKPDERYLLSLKCHCGVCKALMVGESGHGKSGKRYNYYKCASNKRGGHCVTKTFKKDWLEELVIYHTVHDVLQDDIIEYLADRVIEIQEKDAVNYALESLRLALADNTKAIKNIIRAIEMGVITDSTKDRLVELEAQAEDLRIHIAKEEIKKPALTRDHVLFWLYSFKNGDIHDAEFRSRMIDMFVHDVFIENNKVTIVYNFSNNSHSIDFTDIERCSDEHPIVRHRGFEPRTT